MLGYPDSGSIFGQLLIGFYSCNSLTGHLEGKYPGYIQIQLSVFLAHSQVVSEFFFEDQVDLYLPWLSTEIVSWFILKAGKGERCCQGCMHVYTREAY